MIKNFDKRLLAVAGFGLFLGACSPTVETTGTMQNNSGSATQPAPASDEAMESESTTEMNIVETAQSVGTFDTLLAAAQAAGLTETLATTELTVFAPTDAAFDKLPAGTVESLLEDPEQLAEILKYHVVAGSVDSTAVTKLSSATTLQGQDVTIEVDGSNVMVNNAKVIQADVMTSNGIIHVIDTVLLPE